MLKIKYKQLVIVYYCGLPCHEQVSYVLNAIDMSKWIVPTLRKMVSGRASDGDVSDAGLSSVMRMSGYLMISENLPQASFGLYDEGQRSLCIVYYRDPVCHEQVSCVLNAIGFLKSTASTSSKAGSGKASDGDVRGVDLSSVMRMIGYLSTSGDPYWRFKVNTKPSDGSL